MLDNYIDVYEVDQCRYRAFKIRREIICASGYAYDGVYNLLDSKPGIYMLYSDKPDKTCGRVVSTYIGKADLRTNKRGILSRIEEHVKTDAGKRQYHDKWDYALCIVSDNTVKELFTPDITKALEQWFIQLFKIIATKQQDDYKNYKFKLFNYNSKQESDGGTVSQEVDTHFRAILDLIYSPGILGEAVEKQLKVNALTAKLETNKSIVDSIHESVEKHRESDKFNGYSQEFLEGAVTRRILSEAFYDSAKQFKSKTTYKDGQRIYQFYEVCNYLKSQTVLTPQNIAKDMVDTLPEEVFDGDKRFLCLYQKDFVFGKAILNRYLELRFQGDTKQQKAEQLARFVRDRLFIIVPQEACYIENYKNFYDYYINKMTELDITWASDHMNMVLPNILLIYNYDNIVKQGLLATLKEKILDGFSIIKREVKNDSLGGQQDVKFDVVVGNPPYNNDLYLQFVTEGHELASEYTLAITPAKWQAKGGKANEEFRKNIVPYMSKIVYYKDTKDIFDIGEPDGICYYIMGKQIYEEKQIKCICSKNKSLESDWEIHDEKDVILLPRKILNVLGKMGQLGEDSFKQSKYVKNTDTGEPGIMGQLGFKRFTYTSEQDRGEKLKQAGYVEVMQGSKVCGYKAISELLTTDRLDKYKCIESCMLVQGSSSPFDRISNKALGQNLIVVIGPYQVPKGSFQILKYFDSSDASNSFKGYINSKTMSFSQFMGVCGTTMTREFFRFIPDPNDWTVTYVDAPHPGAVPDEKGYYEYDGERYCSLYARYKLTKDEINLIESVIKERK